jgi:DNA-binding NarL/FixJ family response regulator
MTAMSTAPQVVVVGDQIAIRRGLALQFRAAGFHVTGVAGSAAEATRIVVERAPDVALIDLGLGEDEGLQVIAEIAARAPDVALLAYTDVHDYPVLDAIFEAGARGCALKAGSADELFSAVRAVAAGGTYIDPRLRVVPVRPDIVALHVISPREREVLTLAATGLTTHQIAESFGLSEMTVDTHFRNAIRKLGAHNRTHAVALAVAQSEIQLEAMTSVV